MKERLKLPNSVPSLLFVLILSLGISYPVFSQTFVKGKVLGQSSKEPIAYANIGILNSIVGTISNEDGSFFIKIPLQHQHDSLLFSALGYGKRKIPINDIAKRKDITVYLPERSTILEEITVAGKQESPKSFELGNRYFRGGQILADSIYAGSSVALLIDNKYPSYHQDLSFPFYIRKGKVRIFRNHWNLFKFRVRLYEVDTLTRLPGRDILNESIIVESDIKKGWLEFDLSHLNLKVAKPFFIAFEWILNQEDRTIIARKFKEYRKQYPNKFVVDTILIDGKKEPRETIEWADFPGTALSISPLQFSRDNYISYERKSSFDKWKRSDGILTARISVSNQPLSKVEEKSAKSSQLEKEINCSDEDLICKSEKICKDFLNEYSVNGIQLSVSLKGKIVFSQGFGISDFNTQTPVTTATQFRVGSVSKALTSAALVKLISENKLDLDAPIQKYLPSFPLKKYPITTRQLAGHLAGIRHYKENDLSDLVRTEHYINATESTRIFENDSLLFKPSSQYHYSSFGWNLIGAVIEVASQQNYLAFMSQQIWKPIGMNNTYGDIADSLMPNRSKFYMMTGEEAPFEDLSYKYAGGGLLSTTEDLLKYGNELLHGRYLDRDVIKTLFQTQYTSDKKPTNYGLGWQLENDANGHRMWFHAGDLLNTSAYLIIYPDDDIVVAFVANSQEGLLFDVRKIGELFYERR